MGRECHLCATYGSGIRYPFREELTRHPCFVHAGQVTYPTQRTHANVVLDALDSNAVVKLIGGDSVGPNLVGEY